MADNRIIDQLNHLVHINKDAEAGLHTAAENVKNSELETVFGGYAKQHAKFAAELQQEIKRLGGTVSDSGTLGGAMHRAWMDLTSALSGHSAASMLTACENGENSAEIAYHDASDLKPTGQTHTLIEKHRQQIIGFRTRLARLVQETKDGVDFQKND
ncbi:MAG: PA2169 family four-helix-bundle protein [Acidobacteriota bacterium]|nr:PA2169 family four-helix-bundle protein [Acidobacteriota bacterium]